MFNNEEDGNVNISAETLLLVRKAAALRLLSGQDVNSEDGLIAEWAQAELDASEWTLVRRGTDKPMPTDEFTVDQVKAIRDKVAPTLAHPMDDDLFGQFQADPEPIAPVDQPVQPTAAPTDVKPTKRSRRTKEEMETARGHIRQGYVRQMQTAANSGSAWETAHNEALVYADSLGTEAHINLSPAQVREAVVPVVDKIRESWSQVVRQPATTPEPVQPAAAQSVPGDVVEPLSPQAQQTARNVELINQGINPRTMKPFGQVPTNAELDAAIAEMGDDPTDEQRDRVKEMMRANQNAAMGIAPAPTDAEINAAIQALPEGDHPGRLDEVAAMVELQRAAGTGTAGEMAAQQHAAMAGEGDLFDQLFNANN